jgi:iron complex outermembrane receptor protein/vitamin B12 transporter
MKRKRSVLAAVLVLALSSIVSAQNQGSVRGTVADALGSGIPGATVTLLRDGRSVKQATSSGSGEFAIGDVEAGRYQIRAEAQGFEANSTEPFFVGSSPRTADVSLSIGPVRQDVVVTAAAADVPASQTGAPVTVIDAETIQNLEKPDVLEALRLVPGGQIAQAGQRGGLTSFFVRGGASNFNKVLIDGVPANDIGGGFDFSGLAATGVEQVEVLREANSVLYGTDSLAGVVSVTTRRGRTRVPEIAYSVDGGNLGTMRNVVSAGGAVKRFDYFSEYGYFQTDNDLPNNEFRNSTYAGRFGGAIGRGTDLSGAIRRTDTRYGSPGAFDFYEIANDAEQKNDFTHVGITAQSQISDRWQSVIRFASMVQNTHYTNPTPTGQPFDPFGFGANYLGQSVTIRGANGYSTTGRAILDSFGEYPDLFDSHTTRNVIYGQANYHLASGLDLTGGGRLEREEGFTRSGVNPKSESERNNGGVFVEARASVQRVYVSGGIGFEHNAVFDDAVSPRVSVAAYLRNPSSSSMVGDTKLVFNAGKGIKGPAIYQELSSLIALVPPEQADALGLSPIGPERATNVDVGVEQGLARGQLRLRAAFFHNEFSDLIEYVSKNALPQVGVPPAAAAATAFGAYVNAQSYRAKGLELSAEAAVARRLRATASYMFLDAVVTESFTGDALAPAENPAFPGIEIGAFAPLVGARPFRRPAHSGSFMLSYFRGPGQVTVAGYVAGKQDDSTFLSDAFFGNSMLLPNNDLDAAYQKIDLSGSYRIHPRIRWYASIENIGAAEYVAAAGFPALPRTFRTGVSLTLGGDRAMP